jgi:hypothetical protein
MTDATQRDLTEIERQRDAFARLDRISGVELDIAVLRTRFEAALDTLLKELERSVSQDDLREIHREIGEVRRDVSADIQKEIEKIHMEFEKSNAEWAEKIIAGSQMQRLVEQKALQRQIALTVFGAAMSLGAGLVLFWITTGQP